MARLTSILLLAAILAAGCDETDLTSMRLCIEPDLSGEITLTSVAAPESPGPAERATSGVIWSNRLGVTVVRGAFDSISDLAIGDLRFSASVSPEGTGRLEVVVPHGASGRWAELLCPLTDTQRDELVKLVDQSQRPNAIGSHVKIEVTLPGEVVARGIFPGAEGVLIGDRGRTATLTFPVDLDLANHQELRWHVTWMQ